MTIKSSTNTGGFFFCSYIAKKLKYIIKEINDDFPFKKTNNLKFSAFCEKQKLKFSANLVVYVK